MELQPLIPKHGGYRKLKSFQIAQLWYEVTVRFFDRRIEKRSREVHGRDGQDGRPKGAAPSIGSTGSIPSIKSIHSELAANAALVLIGVACGLPDRRIGAQAAAFTGEGGFTGRLFRVRSRRRGGPPRF